MEARLWIGESIWAGDYWHYVETRLPPEVWSRRRDRTLDVRRMREEERDSSFMFMAFALAYAWTY
jgi:hypothetical protein